MWNSGPLVSIGVPVYNREKSVARALDSLLAQTYPNLEIVISDNASTDKTTEVCKAYAAKDARVRYHGNKVRIWSQSNFRRALELSSGEYFTWAAADDIRPPSTIETLLELLLKNEKAVMVHGPVLLVKNDGDDCILVRNEMALNSDRECERIRIFTRELRHRTMLYGLYRKAALDRISYPNPFCFGFGYHICLQMCLLGQIEYIQETMLLYSVRAGGIQKPVPEYLPLTSKNLLTLHSARGITKRWSIFLRAAYHLLNVKTCWISRVSATAAHLRGFLAEHGKNLGRDLLFLLFCPLAAVCSVSYRMIQKKPASLA